jgi:hypothetical protein
MDMLEQEARLFTRYLIGRDANPQAIRLYETVMSTSKPDNKDKKLLDFMTSHPSSIGLIDAGLVFHNATSEARRRLYIMFAILEASPEYCDFFLPKKRSPFYILVIFYSGVRAIIKAGLGLLLVKVIA